MRTRSAPSYSPSFGYSKDFNLQNVTRWDVSYFSSHFVFKFQVNTQECAGQPEEPMSFAGAVVYNGVTLGRTTCYFGPNDPVQYMAIKIDKMELPKSLGNCATWKLHEYSSVREELIDNTDPNLRVAMVVPSDPKLLVRDNFGFYSYLLLSSRASTDILGISGVSIV